jgi:imidazole glycerol-phosphate synthase subunit HisF
MLRTRIIPVLLLRNKGLVKTVKFDKEKYIGDPINAVKIFNDKEVDELVLLDIDASKEKRKPDFEAIKDIASEAFMPLAYGGGITELDDIKKLFSIGIEKVIINTAALQNLQLITQASEIFGDQSIVVCIDVIKNFWGKYHIHSHTNQKNLHTDVVTYAQDAEKSGAGEIILHSVDLDGTMTGYDLKLIEKVSQNIQIPLVACGGAGSIDDLKKGFDAGASALAAGSLFVYHGPHKAVLINFPSQTQLKTLFS